MRRVRGSRLTRFIRHRERGSRPTPFSSRKNNWLSEAILWVFTCSQDQTKKLRSEGRFPQAARRTVVQDFAPRKILARNSLKNERFVKICSRFLSVENLCMACATLPGPSYTFRLPSAGQSETIPRGLEERQQAGRQILKGHARGTRGNNGQRDQDSRSEETISRLAFHSFYTSVEIVEGFPFVFTYDHSYASWTRTRHSKRLGQVPGARQSQGQHQHLYDLVPAHQVEPGRGRDPLYTDSQRGLPAGPDADLRRHHQGGVPRNRNTPCESAIRVGRRRARSGSNGGAARKDRAGQAGF